MPAGPHTRAGRTISQNPSTQDQDQDPDQRPDQGQRRATGAVLRVRTAAPYLLIVAVGLAVGGWADAATTDWGPDDWISLAYGIFLTLGLTFIGRRQQDLQEATANLELREKVGVIESNALRAGGAVDPLWCLYTASDARAALHLYPLADEAQQRDFLLAVHHAFRGMRESGVVRHLSGYSFDCVHEGTRALYLEMGQIVGRGSAEGATAIDEVGRFRDHLEQATAC